AIDQISQHIPVSLGTDSTLTGSATLLDEMKLAADCKLVNYETIYSMVSKQAAIIFNLEKTEIEINSIADFFCLPIKSVDYIENIFESNPSDVAMVMVNGELKLIDQKIETNESPKHSLQVGSKKKNVSIDVVNLKKRIARKVPIEILKLNSLWNLIE
ncbi:hypothetical protein L0244_35135, partial [bacterium]|nr:hypothetical protein [bacterium]